MRPYLFLVISICLFANGPFEFASPLGPAQIRGSVIDGDGSIYITGATDQDTLPGSAGVYQPRRKPGICPPVAVPCTDAFVAKLDPTGTRVVWATFLGGGSQDHGLAIALAPGGDLVVAGTTYSTDFPVTDTAYQRQYAGGSASSRTELGPGGDLFVARLTEDGARLSASTYFGGGQHEVLVGMSVTADGAVVVLATTTSSEIPITPGAFLTQRPAASRSDFLTRFRPTLANLDYSTWVRAGGALAVGRDGAPYVAGVLPEVSASVLLKLDPAGTRAVFERRFEKLAGPDDRQVLAIDSRGDLWLSLEVEQRFRLVKLSPGDAAVLAQFEQPGLRSETLALDTAGNVHLLGLVRDALLPVTPAAYLKRGCVLGNKPYLVRLNPAGDVVYRGYLHEPARLLAALPSGGLLLAGDGPALGIAVFEPDAAPAVGVYCVANSARLDGGGVSPGELITLIGFGLGPETGVTYRLEADGRVSTQLGGVRVLINNAPSPLLYVQSRQINAIVPFSLEGATEARIEVEFGGRIVSSLTRPHFWTDLAVFSLDGTGAGPAAAVNEDGTVNSPSNPAPLGSLIQIFATGGGVLDPPGVDGAIVSPERLPRMRFQAAVGLYQGFPMEVLYAGGAPGLVTGVIQINARLPASLPSFLDPAAVRLWVGIFPLMQEQAVTIAVRP